MAAVATAAHLAPPLLLTTGGAWNHVKKSKFLRYVDGKPFSTGWGLHSILKITEASSEGPVLMLALVPSQKVTSTKPQDERSFI
uniref:Uncharacterized protein n=1 Tax=Setaria viridis TaxID=4556 RepID=A0A4V6DAZ3_SETVI|nr:hypothetical protein SEVIR_2G113300v2 [Setaria viridis]